MKNFYTLLVLFFLLQNSFAQQTIQGIPWTGEKGITLTVDQIMELDKNTVYDTRLKIQHEHDVPLHKKRNPDAPQISSYPPVENIENRNGVENSANATQAIGASWNGVNFGISGGYAPPDCNGAAGPTQILTCANSVIQVYNKTGALGALNANLNTFFTSVRNGSSISDTHIRYDRLSQRWFVVTINVAGTNNRVLFAVSSGPVITGAASFTFFYFQFNTVAPAGNAGQFFDYPTLGIDANALYIGGNCFGAGFTGSIIFVVNKSSILGAGPIVASAFRTVATNSSGLFSPQGVDNDDPSATEGYFVGVDAGLYSILDLIRVNTPGGVPSVTILPALTVPTTSNPINQVALGSTNNLDGLDDRPFAAHLMKNKLTGVSTLWTAHNIQVNTTGVASGTGGRNASRWYQIGNMTTTPVLVQSGTLFDGAASNMRSFWIPSIAMNGQGHALLGSSTASAINRADANVAGRYSCDALGTLQPFVLATASSTAYNIGLQAGRYRWGDYSQVVIDPNDNMTWWTFQDYCDATNDWAVRVIQLIAPAPPPPASLNALSTVGCSASVTVNIVANSTPNCTGFFDPGPDIGGPGFANHISASVTGGITVNSVTFIDATHVNLNLNTSVCVPGTYVITITNPDGQTTTINITLASTLPVELVSFTGEPSAKGNLLKWSTASEINNNYFLVDRSKDANYFESIGKVKGSGNKTTLSEYSFMDAQPYEGVSYYRLEQMDFNGDNSYSNVISVRSGNEVFGLAGTSSDYENQTVNVFLNNDVSQKVDYRLVNVLGSTVIHGSHTALKGVSTITIDGRQLVRGIYYLTITNGNNILTKKIFY